MTGLPVFDDLDLFDEAGYLRLYPGIAEAMLRGHLDSVRGHYLAHGRAEGRRPNDVDPAFYLTAYPAIATDLGRAPSEEDAAPHYVFFGRARGYLPNAGAPRVTDGAAMASPFGGLWTDRANARDLVRARRDLGWIKPWEAMVLERFAADGIAPFDRPTDKAKLLACGLAIEQAFTGRWPDLRFARAEPDEERLSWTPDLVAEPVSVLDPHMVSADIRAIVLDRQVLDFLALLFEAPPRLTASRAGLRAAWSADRDVAWMSHSLPLQAVAVTFCLEEAPATLSSVWPGTHRLPDLPWPGGHISLPEARRMGLTEPDPDARSRAIGDLIAGRGAVAHETTLGFRTIRHANLIHAHRMPDPPGRHLLLTAWYCPSFVVPGYQEAGWARWHERDGGVFASGAYPAMDPAD